MKADLQFVKETFHYFNDRIFVEKLPEPPFRISDAGRHMGLFMGKQHRDGRPKRSPLECYIQISRRHDVPREVLEDVVIHEMLHYCIWYHNMKDTSPHGRIFREMMKTVNERFGRHISISHRLDSETRDSDDKVKAHYMLCTRWADGSWGFTPMARTRIFEMYRAFKSIRNVLEMRWYFSTDPYFNRFPNFIRPKYMRLTDEIRDRLASDARECVCDGQTFRLKTD